LPSSVFDVVLVAVSLAFDGCREDDEMLCVAPADSCSGIVDFSCANVVGFGWGCVVRGKGAEGLRERLIGALFVVPSVPWL